MAQNNNRQAPGNALGPRFDGMNAMRISETYTMGPDARAYLNNKFAYLGKELKLKNEKYHDHGYAAFCRKHCDNAITVGCNSRGNLIDVGGHAMRTHVSQFADGTAWHTRIHSMLPIVDMNDQLRHYQWEEKYVNSGWAWPLPNSCNVPATDAGLCQCNGPNGLPIIDTISAFKSIDSAYYPGVVSGIEFEQIKRFKATNKSIPAYYTFHDYHAAIRSGKMEGQLFDNEGQFKVETIEDGGRKYTVKVQTRGNPFKYEHGVINTTPTDKFSPDTWIIFKDGVTIIYNVIYRLDTGAGYDYITVRSQVLDGKHPLAETNRTFFATQKIIPAAVMQARGVTWAEQVRQNLDFDEENMEGWFYHVTKSCRTVSNKLKQFMLSIWNLKTQMKNKFAIGLRLKSSIEGREIFEITIIDKKTYDIEHARTFTFNQRYLTQALEVLAGKAGREDMVRAMRVVTLIHIKECSKEAFFDEAACVAGAVNYAMWLNAEMMLDMFAYYDCNSKVEKVQAYLKGSHFLQLGSMWAQFKRWATQRLFPIISTFLIVTVLLSIFNWAVNGGAANAVTGNKFMVRAYDGDAVAAMSSDFMTILLVSVIVTVTQTLLPKKINTQWLKGTCVTDKTRLDLKKAGVFDPHWKFRCSDWDIRGMNGYEAAEKLGCNKHNKLEAGQIGPIIWGGEYRTPTVKHCCKQNVMAASIRATTNKLRPDPAYLQTWEESTLIPMFDELIHSINLAGGISVDYNTWLKKYDLEYREKIENRLRQPDVLEDPKSHMYDSFPKKELQYTKCCHSLKDTAINDVKERQISGPSIDKKIIANALVNLLEEHASQAVKGYCGRENWTSIAAKIDEANMFIPNNVWCCADGSGFDMTQTKLLQEAFNRQMERLLKTGLVDLGPLVTFEQVMECFKDSLTLFVNVDRGSVQYRAEGRASGDGWTTFGNTMLMVSYWRFTLELAGVTQYKLLVKGDDVLFCIPKKFKEQVESVSKLIFADENRLDEYGLGQILKKLNWGDIEDCDFLSCMFFHASTGVRMVRIPDRVFQTMPWSLKISPGMNNLEQTRKELIYSKGQSLLAWSMGLPIFEKYARKLISLGQAGNATEYNKYADEGREWVEQDDKYQFIAWLGYRYGITDAEVAEIEDAIDRITEIDQIIEIPALGKFQE